MFKTTTIKASLILVGIALLSACGSDVRPGAIGGFFSPSGNSSQPVVENPGSGPGSGQITDIMVFATDEIYNGNFAQYAEESANPARDGADSLCESYRTPKMEGRTIRALLSIDHSDHIENMPKSFGISYDRPIVGDLGLRIADKWSDLLDKQIANSLKKAVSALSRGGYYWTGSTSDGFTDEANNCQDWTSESSSDSASVGLSTYDDEFWLASKVEDCKYLLQLVCVAY